MSTAPLNFRKSGEGPPIVLLHGLFGSLENLGVIAKRLSESFTVYSFDLPNHGKSPHFSDMDLIGMAGEVVESVITHVGREEVAIIGHSLGGKVAMEIALGHANVSKLVVLDIAPSAYAHRHAKIFEGLNALPLTDSGLSRADLDRTLSSYVEEPAVRSFLLKNLSKTEAGYSWRMNLAALENNYLDFISENTLAEFKGPVLFIKGGESDYLGEQHQQDVLVRFPNATLKIVPSAGHWLHAEQPAQVARLIKQFLLK